MCSSDLCTLNSLIQAEQPTLFQEFESFRLELVSHGFLANLELKPTLISQIKSAQKGHESIDGIKRKISLERRPGFTEDAEGVLWFNGRLCVPDVKKLKDLILK